MISDATRQAAQRIINNARIKGEKKIEVDAVLGDLRCTFTRGGNSITIVVLSDLDRVCCYQHSPSHWRRPDEQEAFLVFSRQIRSLQGSLERRLNHSKVSKDAAAVG